MFKNISIAIVSLNVAHSAFPQSNEDDTAMSFNGVSFELPERYSVKTETYKETDMQSLHLSQGATLQEIEFLIEAGLLYGDNEQVALKAPEKYPARTLKILVIDLPMDQVPTGSPGDKAKSIHSKFSKGFMRRWGTGSFCYFHDDFHITSCINVYGAFIAAHTKLIDRKLVSVDAIDFPEAMRILHDDNLALPDDLFQRQTSERYAMLKEGALGDEALHLLKSARTEN